jgi:hypothetical protein
MLGVTAILLLGAGCELINPEEQLPVQIKLTPFDFQVQSGQGSSRNKFTETWVYANSSFVGAFDPSATVNWLGEGPTTFTFRPGIRNNGILDDAVTYPLVTGYTITPTVAPGDVIEVAPVSRYQPQADFPLLADFEQTNPFTDNRDTVSGTSLEISDLDAVDGTHCGRIVLTETANAINVGHAIPITSLPTDGTPAYLEFWYKTDIEMGIGLVGIDVSGSEFESLIYIAKPSAEWNMLYLELTDWLAASGFTAYEIIFISEYPVGSTQPEYEILLDNIKVVHL